MALIEHVGHAIERPAGTKLFRSLGPRRARMARWAEQREEVSRVQWLLWRAEMHREHSRLLLG